MASLCVVCSQPIQTSPGTLAQRGCFACVNSTLALLAEIELMAPMLDTTPHRSTDSDAGPRRPFYGPRIPIDLDVMATLDMRSVPGEDNVRSMLGTLNGIANAIREQRGEPRPPAVILCRELGYLRGRMSWCATRDDFADVVADIRDLHRHVRIVARGDRPQSVGRCPAIIGRVRRCATRLEVFAYDDEIRCPNPKCGAHWDRVDYLELAEEVGKIIERTLIDRRALAALTGRSERVIRQHVTPVRYAQDGAALYDATAAVRQLAVVAVRARRDTPSAVVDTGR